MKGHIIDRTLVGTIQEALQNLTGSMPGESHMFKFTATIIHRLKVINEILGNLEKDFNSRDSTGCVFHLVHYTAGFWHLPERELQSQITDAVGYAQFKCEYLQIEPVEVWNNELEFDRQFFEALSRDLESYSRLLALVEDQRVIVANPTPA